MVTLTIDNRAVTVPDGTTILDAARSARLRYSHPVLPARHINEMAPAASAAVEVEGSGTLAAQPPCDTRWPRASWSTNSPGSVSPPGESAAASPAQHGIPLSPCTRSGNCKLQRLTNDYNLLGAPLYRGPAATEPGFHTSPVVPV
ncbi:MAG: 2Fe-2S iron-sulfur cluster-binding protein [Evtepia gabavorous]